MVWKFLSSSLHEHFFEIENISSKPKLLAWCSSNNKISVAELETEKEFTKFDGVKLSKTGVIFQLFHFWFKFAHNSLKVLGGLMWKRLPIQDFLFQLITPDPLIWKCSISHAKGKVIKYILMRKYLKVNPSLAKVYLLFSFF